MSRRRPSAQVDAAAAAAPPSAPTDDSWGDEIIMWGMRVQILTRGREWWYRIVHPAWDRLRIGPHPTETEAVRHARLLTCHLMDQWQTRD